jgi:hypothetical protein
VVGGRDKRKRKIPKKGEKENKKKKEVWEESEWVSVWETMAAPSSICLDGAVWHIWFGYGSGSGSGSGCGCCCGLGEEHEE